jgi:NADPH2 dehydrogenase
MSEAQSFPKVGHFKTVDAFRAHLASLKLDLPCDDRILSAVEGSPMAGPVKLDDGFAIGNRWCIHPMEGWDATADGQPSEQVLRRWRHFGQSGAKLIWGGEAFAVQPDGRANPHQLCHNGDDAQTERSLRQLLDALLDAHRAAVGNTDGLLVGLQLTHSGRFCKPYDKRRMEPMIVYHHPVLDRRFGIAPDDDSRVMSDDYIHRLIDNYLAVSEIAHRVGFHFVDVKHCHGYLAHEFLSAFTRPGPFGGSFENRTRFARTIIQRINAEIPGLRVGLRLSAFDLPPFKPDAAKNKPGQLGPGIPDDFPTPYVYGFGCNPDNPLEIDLAEPTQFLLMLEQLGVRLINVSGGSPYYNPHVQRPAMFPPSDGYQPPEDPLVGVARQVAVTRTLKQACPNMLLVGTGYTYLQEYLPHVAQAVVREGWVDSVGLGRLVLSYWDLPLDTLAGRPFNEKKLCRTFSDCTTAPRNGIISGCYPLDPYYKDLPENAELKEKKAAMRRALTVKPA